MADEKDAQPPAGDEEPERQVWRPSRLPEHRAGNPVAATRIVERQAAGGPLRSVVAELRKPIVRIFLGIALLVAGIIVVDATVDSNWAQRDAPSKPNKHASQRVPGG